MDKSTTIQPSVLDQYTNKTGDIKTAKKTELDQQAFLNLMVTQLKNQDPTKPMESADFLSQIAQFGTVNGISGLQKSLTTMASALSSSQALQASTMVGRDVIIPRDSFTLQAGSKAPVSAVLPSNASNVHVSISDSAGQQVFSTSLGAKSAGNLHYDWNGLRDNGQQAASGKYTVKISATIDNVPTALTPAVTARVDSVTLGRNGLPPTLNVDGYGAVDMADVLEIQ
ncbi:MAG: flagellar hook assembly protein FlgD [Gammaproteobacteria bacterium]|nr:flagellar hook assembly protein FlgD [Gammaproteobacteria bacterium]